MTFYVPTTDVVPVVPLSKKLKNAVSAVLLIVRLVLGSLGSKHAQRLLAILLSPSSAVLNEEPSNTHEPLLDNQIHVEHLALQLRRLLNATHRNHVAQ